MKKLLSIILAVFIATASWSQTDEEIIAAKLLQKCKAELEEVAKKKVPISDIAFNTDGHWLILYGDYGYSYSYLPTSLENLLSDLNSKKTSIKQALLDGDTWVLLYDKNKYTSQNYYSTAVLILESCRKKGSELKGIFRGPNNEVLGLYGTNGYQTHSCPMKAAEKIQQINKKHQAIRNAAFGDKCWVVNYGNNGFCFQDVPEDLANFLKTSITKKYNVNFVRLFHDKWFVVYDDYKFATNVK